MDTEKIKELVISAFVRELEKGRKTRPPTDNLHISELVFNCPRAIFLRRTIGDFFFRFESIFRLNLGRKIHEIPILPYHEISVKWKNIIGTPDEYGDGMLIEKKTTYHPPQNTPYTHHQLQLEFYKFLLTTNGYPVLDSFVLYYDLSNPQDPIKILKPKIRNDAEIRADIQTRRKYLMNHLEKSKECLPPRNPSWMCKYCDYVYMCFLSDKKLSMIVNAAKNAKLGTTLYDL